MRTFFLLLLSLVAITSPLCTEQTPRNLIFMIGDGMGTAQVTMLMCERDYAPTQLDRADNVVLTKSYSANSLVTDSAAAGTALATGYKTKAHQRLCCFAAPTDFKGGFMFR